MIQVTVLETGFSPLVIDIDPVDELALHNDLIDFRTYVAGMVAGKINNTKKRMALVEAERLKNDSGVATMPASAEGLVNSAVAAPGYLNRNEREIAEAAKL